MVNDWSKVPISQVASIYIGGTPSRSVHEYWGGGIKWASAKDVVSCSSRYIRETEETIRETIEFAKELPLDIALFHVAAPCPGTPFFYEVVEKGWFRKGTRWEDVDMDRGTVLDYPNLSAERLLYWQKRAFREWALRPAPMMTYLKMLLSDWSTMRTALSVGLEHLSWASTDSGAPIERE